MVCRFLLSADVWGEAWGSSVYHWQKNSEVVNRVVYAIDCNKNTV